MNGPEPRILLRDRDLPVVLVTRPHSSMGTSKLMSVRAGLHMSLESNKESVVDKQITKYARKGKTYKNIFYSLGFYKIVYKYINNS